MSALRRIGTSMNLVLIVALLGQASVGNAGDLIIMVCLEPVIYNFDSEIVHIT